MSKKSLVKILTSIFCIALCLITSILPAFADANTVEAGGQVEENTEWEYDLRDYPYLTMQLHTTQSVNRTNQGIAKMPMQLLNYNTFDFIVANVGSKIILTFKSQNVSYIAQCGKMIFSFKRVKQSENGTAIKYALILDLVFQNCTLKYANSPTNTVFQGDLTCNTGICYFITQNNEVDPSTITPYYGTEMYHPEESGSQLFFQYAVTTLRQGSTTNKLLNLSNMKVDFYLPFGSTSYEGAVYNGDVEYGFGTVLDAVDFAQSEAPEHMQELPYAWRFTFGRQLYTDAFNNGFTTGRTSSENYTIGYEEGLRIGTAEGYAEGHNVGYSQGFNEGAVSADNFNIGTLMGGIFNGMYNLFHGILDFEIPLGNSSINFAGIAGACIALILIIIVVRFMLR